MKNTPAVHTWTPRGSSNPSPAMPAMHRPCVPSLPFLLLLASHAGNKITVVIGTPKCMAPKQVMGPTAVTCGAYIPPEPHPVPPLTPPTPTLLMQARRSLADVIGTPEYIVPKKILGPTAFT